MFEIEYPAPAEKVILASFCNGQEDPRLFDEDLAEMVMLLKTAGAEVIDVVVQNGETPKASTYLGSGKLDEIAHSMKEHGCTALVIDAELSPGQVRNIEKIIEAKVLDRNQLILDIFALHAKSNESKIQVELAQMETMYPRLTHAWSHFSKQYGGMGTRGPGEKQLEVDRRLVKKKITDLKERLEKIERSRDTQRSQRSSAVKGAIVGYTNVGKSTLLNALSKSDVLVENKLFATLDTASRKVYLPHTGEIILSDTVGFLRKLPHDLVASFRSTLEVVREADFLIIVMDATSAWMMQQHETVLSVLSDMSITDKPMIRIFNKADMVSDPFTVKSISNTFPDALLMSALRKEDNLLLKEKIRETVTDLLLKREMERIVKQKTSEYA